MLCSKLGHFVECPCKAVQFETIYLTHSYGICPRFKPMASVTLQASMAHLHWRDLYEIMPTISQCDNVILTYRGK
jgi:hypothetical protein